MVQALRDPRLDVRSDKDDSAPRFAIGRREAGGGPKAGPSKLESLDARFQDAGLGELVFLAKNNIGVGASQESLDRVP